MSAPNDPGHPRAGDSPGPANGSPDHEGAPGRIADPGDVPPWQRGRAPRPQPTGPRPARGEGHGGGVGQGVDARLNRFLAGAASASAPEADSPAPADRGDAPPRPEARPEPRPEIRPEAYASELPDLSGPTPRPPQRKPERPENAGRPAARVQVGTRHQGPVRASMQIRRVDPWSVLKVSLVLSVALFFVWMIAVAFLYLVLGGMGVWSKLNSNVGDLLTSAGGSGGGELVSSGTIFGGATLVGLVNIVLLTAMATVGAFIYNLTTDVVGGVEVTLADRD